MNNDQQQSTQSQKIHFTRKNKQAQRSLKVNEDKWTITMNKQQIKWIWTCNSSEMAAIPASEKDSNDKSSELNLPRWMKLSSAVNSSVNSLKRRLSSCKELLSCGSTQSNKWFQIQQLIQTQQSQFPPLLTFTPSNNNRPAFEPILLLRRLILRIVWLLYNTNQQLTSKESSRQHIQQANNDQHTFSSSQIPTTPSADMWFPYK